MAKIGQIYENARQAAEAWREVPLSQRITILQPLKKFIQQNLDTLVDEIQQVTRKSTIDVLTGEFFLVLETIRFYQKQATSILRDERRKSPLFFRQRKAWVTYEPYGVILLFSPWNYPVQLTLVPLLSALIAGNAVIVKPSEKIPGLIPILDRLLQSMNLPKDLVHIVKGGAEVGQQLIAGKPNKVFFTGSRDVGKQVLKQAAEHLIPCDLELSGKDAMLIFADSDLERAAHAAVWGSFVNAGQVCVSVERVYVEAPVYQQFVDLVVEKTNQLAENKLAQSFMTTRESFNVARVQVEEAISHGAEKFVSGACDEHSLFFPPTVLTKVTHDMKIMRDETFAPVLPIMSFKTEDEALHLLNDSPFGLNASLFTKNKKRIKRLLSYINTGNVYVNDCLLNISNIHLPFGGVKESGIGRYHGREGLRTFVQSKSVMVYVGRAKRNNNWYPYTQSSFTFLKHWFQKFY